MTECPGQQGDPRMIVQAYGFHVGRKKDMNHAGHIKENRGTQSDAVRGGRNLLAIGLSTNGL